MRKSQFTHVIRAAAGITNEKVFVVGSRAIPGQHANPPAALLQSPELDLYPARNPDIADLIEALLQSRIDEVDVDDEIRALARPRIDGMSTRGRPDVEGPDP